MIYELPFQPIPQIVNTVFPNGFAYQMRMIFVWGPNPSWLLDINDAEGTPIVCGIPMVTGADLFEQYGYLGFNCKLYCTSDGSDPTVVPTLTTLGSTSHIWIDG